MSQLVSGSFAKKIDGYAINELGIPSLTLMQRAAEGLFEEAEKLLCKKSDSILVAAGVGNNGADGLNAAYLLYEAGYRDIRIAVIGNPEKRTEEFRFHEDRLRARGVDLKYIRDKKDLEALRLYAPDLVIDGIFGIGLKRQVEGIYLELIDLLNELRESHGTRLLSADVPSGLDADRGRNMCGEHRPVQADVTVTFGFDKLGLWMGRGPSVRGRLIVRDIGYPEDICQLLSHNNYDVIETSDIFIKSIEHKLKFRGPNANKGSYGKLLIIGGSVGMAGAAFLSGLGAYKSGMGMVRYFGPEQNRLILQTLLPEAMYDSYDAGDLDGMRKSLKQAFSWADHFILGPGLSCSPMARDVVEAFSVLWREDAEKERKKLLLIDADGLNIISEEPELGSRIMGERTIITPHVGEMSRLMHCSIAEIKADPIASAAAYASEHGANVILKDASTVTAAAGGSVFINIAGSAALAKAGSGDVLSGTVAGVCAVLADDIERTLPTAVFLHALAGSLAVGSGSEHGTLARETALSLPAAFVAATGQDTAKRV